MGVSMGDPQNGWFINGMIEEVPLFLRKPPNGSGPNQKFLGDTCSKSVKSDLSAAKAWGRIFSSLSTRVNRKIKTNLSWQVPRVRREIKLFDKVRSVVFNLGLKKDSNHLKPHSFHRLKTKNCAARKRLHKQAVHRDPDTKKKMMLSQWTNTQESADWRLTHRSQKDRKKGWLETRTAEWPSSQGQYTFRTSPTPTAHHKAVTKWWHDKRKQQQGKEDCHRLAPKKRTRKAG